MLKVKTGHYYVGLGSDFRHDWMEFGTTLNIGQTECQTEKAHL